MEEIKVGEYVRFKKGIIDKVTHIEKNTKKMWFKKTYGRLTTKSIVKHSKNIIDLIEVGDYVNGKKVTKTNLDKTMNSETAILCGDSSYDCLDVIYKNLDIKSIVTKEQFNQVKYEVS